MQALDDGVISLTDPVTKFFNDENPPIFAPKNPYGDNLDCVCMHRLFVISSDSNDKLAWLHIPAELVESLHVVFLILTTGIMILFH